MEHWTASVVATGYGQSPNNTQIAAPQTATNQTSESQTSTSSRFMVGFCQMMLVWPRSAVLRGAVCLPNPCIQVLLLRANNLGFGAENSSKENLGNVECCATWFSQRHISVGTMGQWPLGQ